MSGDSAPGRENVRPKPVPGARLARGRIPGEARGQGEGGEVRGQSVARATPGRTLWDPMGTLSFALRREPMQGFQAECDVTSPSAGSLLPAKAIRINCKAGAKQTVAPRRDPGER